MMHYTTAQALGQARLAELHRQAQRDALGRTARRARRARQHTPALLAAFTWRARRPAGIADEEFLALARAALAP
jgi:hypothetical protein